MHAENVDYEKLGNLRSEHLRLKDQVGRWSREASLAESWMMWPRWT